MKRLHYILKDKEPVPVDDIIEWAKWFETADDERQVDLTVVDIGEEASTVFTGLEYRLFGDGPPLLFETMVFGGGYDGETWRYSTWDEAEAGHKKVVERVMGGKGNEAP